MSNIEFVKKPQGFIDLYMHKGKPRFVPVGDGSDPTQGYFVYDKADIVQEAHIKNLIVTLASTFMANRMRPGTSWSDGINYLEVGTGVGTGTQQAPQAETIAATALRVPLARKAFTSWTYLDANGFSTGTPTNTLQFTTIFLEAEANGSIVEMGLFGGGATATLGSGMMFNYKTFPAWNKTNTMQLSIIWKVTF